MMPGRCCAIAASRSRKRTRVVGGAFAWITAGLVLFAGCGPLSGEDVEAPDPFADGVLNTTAYLAPAGSNAQYLARLAAELGWEDDVGQDMLLREAVEDDAFQEKVEPRLLGLFFRKGFSVLPKLGEGHEFARDTVVRGDVVNARFLVKTRDPIRIIFLGLADNIVIIYPKDGQQPQVFTRNQASTVALRESRLKSYLN